MTKAGRLLVCVLLLAGASCDAGDRPSRDANPARPAETPAPAATDPSVGGLPATPSETVPLQPGEVATGAGDQPRTTTAAAPRRTPGPTPSTTTTTAPQARGCPRPRTCPIYKIEPGVRGWRPDKDGIARVRFYLDPTPPPNSGVTAGQVREAYFRAMRVWESASPRVRFVYLGDRTTPAVIGDGISQFAYGAGVTMQTDHEGYMVEADNARMPQATGDSWTPCEQRDGSCTDTTTPSSDLQELLTHELGHTIGLADLADTPETHFLTMQHELRSNQRFRNTLALGDVLGVRHLYPTDAPMPPVYEP